MVVFKKDLTQVGSLSELGLSDVNGGQSGFTFVITHVIFQNFLNIALYIFFLVCFLLYLVAFSSVQNLNFY